MNVDNARKIISALCPEGIPRIINVYQTRAEIIFWCGRARDTVADFGLSAFYNSGRDIEKEVSTRDRYVMKAARKLLKIESQRNSARSILGHVHWN